MGIHWSDKNTLRMAKEIAIMGSYTKTERRKWKSYFSIKCSTISSSFGNFLLIPVRYFAPEKVFRWWSLDDE